MDRAAARRGASNRWRRSSTHEHQSTPESGGRGGFDGHKKKKGSKVHIAVDTLGILLTLKVTSANEQEREQVAELAAAVRKAADYNVELAFVDQGYTGDEPAKETAWKMGAFRFDSVFTCPFSQHGLEATK
jgi:hypothetical protein